MTTEANWVSVPSKRFCKTIPAEINDEADNKIKEEQTCLRKDEDFHDQQQRWTQFLM